MSLVCMYLSRFQRKREGGKSHFYRPFGVSLPQWRQHRTLNQTTPLLDRNKWRSETCASRPLPRPIKGAARSNVALTQQLPVDSLLAQKSIRITFCSAENSILPTPDREMLRTYIVAIVLVTWACGEASSAYLKAYEDGELPEVCPFLHFYLWNFAKLIPTRV